MIKRQTALGFGAIAGQESHEAMRDKGYDPTHGARPMRRAVEKYLEDPLAEELLRGNIKQGDTLEAHAVGQQLAFKVAGSVWMGVAQ